MPRLSKLWIGPLVAFGFTFILTDDTIERVVGGVLLALIGMFLQMIIQYINRLVLSTKYGFLKNEENFIETILMLAAEMVKADGKIDESELAIIKEHLVKDFCEEEAEAQVYFANFKIYLAQPTSLKQLCKVIDYDFDEPTKGHLIFLLVSLATADGILKESEITFIKQLARLANIRMATVVNVLNLFKFKREHTYQQKSRQQQKRSSSRTSTSHLKRAYALLGIIETATINQIKKAYRKLAKIHHPDKVAHLGMAHQQKAKEKFQLIVAAYDTIKEKRGI